jgi:hypothetical protein
MTSRTTAHLVSTLDDRYYDIERFHGVVGARLAAESHSAAIDQYEKISAEEGIACDFERVDGYLFVPPGGPPRRWIKSSQPCIARDDDGEASSRSAVRRIQQWMRARIPTAGRLSSCGSRTGR